MADESGEWLVPFRGRNPSSYFEQNFLWRSKNIYVMDNHRAALWCWLQHVDVRRPHSIFHVDRHFDTLPWKLWDQLPASWTITIEEYLNHPLDDGLCLGEVPYFRFDNYLSIHLDQFGSSVTGFECATHLDGARPDHQFNEVSPWELPFSILDTQKSPWIMNIDLDYFFCDAADDNIQRFMSDDYIQSIFKSIRAKIDSGDIVVTTIALSPEFCGGWEASENVLSVAMNALGTDFLLPRI